MKIINILDYNGNKYKIKIDKNNIHHIEVLVISGDELIRIYYNDGSHSKTYDVSNYNFDPRSVNFYDGRYDVYPKDITLWMTRNTSYEVLFHGIKRLEISEDN